MSNPDHASTSARVGERIRALRTARYLSVRELATMLGVSAGTVSAIENGRTGVSVDRLGELAEVLRVSPAELLGLTADPTPLAAEPEPEPDPVTSPRRTDDQPAGGAAERRSWRDFPPLEVDVVMASAIRCFVDVGYHGATMRTIAAGAEMSVAGVYHHYASKQELLVRILDLTMDELDWRLPAARAGAGADPSARLAALVEALALFHTLRRDLAFIGASEMRSLEPAARRRIAARRTGIQRLLDLEITAAVADGSARTARPLDAGRAIATMCTSLPQWFDNAGPISPEQIAREYAELALRMIDARPRVRGGP
jgi:AcrR family transcriptional regulator/transcriptional regulator with XRE-family HTH domain